MIIQSQYKQHFKEKLQVEENVAGKWGYTLPSINLQPSQTNVPTNRPTVSINEKINPITVQSKEKFQNNRLVELKKEMVAEKLQKKLDKISEERGENSINVISFMNEKIQEYNDTVDHLHITKQMNETYKKKNKEEVKPKSENEKLLELIQENQMKIKRSNNLHEKISLNHSISQLYHKYSKIMYENEIVKKQQPASPTKRSQQSQTHNQQTQKPSKISLRPLYIDYKRKNQRYNLNVKAPYISQDFIHNLKQMDKGIKQKRSLADVYKFRVQKLSPIKKKSIQSELIFEDSPQEMKTNEDNTFQEEYSKLYDSVQDFQDNPNNQSQRKLHRYVKGRSSRFTKPSGDKFLIKFDSEKKTKQLLQKMSRQQIVEVKSVLPTYNPMYKRKLQVPDSLKGEDREVMEHMIEEQDDMYYWTTCRNQKLNLLLKRNQKKK